MFLSSAEIIQLYKHTCENRNCFCIILSPRSANLKMLCVQLTKEGFNQIKKLESDLKNDSKCNGSMAFYLLKDQISKSESGFYHQIPCRFSKEPCVCHDIRDVDQELSQMKEYALSPFCFFW